MKTGFQSVDRYIAAQPEAVQPILELVRRTIVEALPEAEETISYQMPAYRLRGGIVIYFAAWKKHYSLYPVTAEIVAALGKELAPYEFNDRGTLRFRFDQPVPVKLIQRIVRLRVASFSKPL